MPLGNGTVGINAWAEPGGDLLFYVAMNGAYSEHARLLKLCRIRLRLEPSGFSEPGFRQALIPQLGEMHFSGGAQGRRVSALLWVEEDRPVIHATVDSDQPVSVSAHVEPLRPKHRQVPQDPAVSKEILATYGLQHAPEPVVLTADTVIQGLTDTVALCHHNGDSSVADNLALQGLEDLVGPDTDVLNALAFGVVVTADSATARDSVSLHAPPATAHHVVVQCYRSRAAGESAWFHEATRGSGRLPSTRPRRLHRTHWRAFDDRSYVRVYGFPEAEALSAAYRLQRYLSAWAGKGPYPISSNGSIFTADWGIDGEAFGADFRRWGGAFCFRSLRLCYWPMLVAGDAEYMQPLFAWFRGLVPLARERTRRYFGHEGVFFPECSTPWGTYPEWEYGWDRDGMPVDEAVNAPNRSCRQVGLELLALALDFYDFTQDNWFLTTTLAPLAEGILAFFDEHYERDADGSLLIVDAPGIGGGTEARNPAPVVAGLHAVVPRIIQAAASGEAAEASARAERLLDALPPLPRSTDGKGRLAAAFGAVGEHPGPENPELSSVFPYRLFARDKGDLDVAVGTFRTRAAGDRGGCSPDPIQAAYLGLTNDARDLVVKRLAGVFAGGRFPAFWGPGESWVPDQAHGSVMNMALQAMLVQYDGGNLSLFPAWPRDWDVEFRLHAPFGTTVECSYRRGQIESLTIDPAGRESVTIHEPF